MWPKYRPDGIESCDRKSAAAVREGRKESHHHKPIKILLGILVKVI